MNENCLFLSSLLFWVVHPCLPSLVLLLMKQIRRHLVLSGSRAFLKQSAPPGCPQRGVERLPPGPPSHPSLSRSISWAAIRPRHPPPGVWYWRYTSPCLASGWQEGRVWFSARRKFRWDYNADSKDPKQNPCLNVKLISNLDDPFTPWLYGRPTESIVCRN